MKSYYYFPVVTCFLLCSFQLFAQVPPPIKWGEIPSADIEMTSYAADSNASALILCDFGESTINNDLNIEYVRHMRVKILNQKGYDWGTHSVMIYSADKTEYISDIRGATYSLENGKIIKTELDDDDVFKEKVDDERTTYKFTLPALKPGCIIEFSYKITSDGLWFMRSWAFQHDEPVKWSEYRIRTPRSISYAIVTLGFENYAIEELEEATQVFSGSASAFFGETIVRCNQYRWAVNNVPAIRDEPFITTVDDYKNQVVVQLSGYAYPGGVKKVLNDWGTLVNELIEHDNFGAMIDDTKSVKKLCSSITANCKTQKEKLEAVYNWVSNSIVRTGSARLFADQEPDDVIETKKGSNADITFLFLSMLKCLEIEAQPVILSTRGNGKIRDIYPMISQFNYVITRAMADSQYYMIDPTNPLRPMDLLPFSSLNTKGLIIKENTVQWTGITSAKSDNETAQSRITINEDGTISGYSEILYTDYGALFFRDEMLDKEPEEIAKDIFETEKFGFEIDSIEVVGLDSIHIKPYVKLWFHSSNYAQSNGDMIYVNPFIINRMWDNPLKMKNRKFPLDFGVKAVEKTIYTITIPDSFEVKETPKAKLISPGSFMSFDRKVQTEGNQIQILDVFNIKEVEVKTQNYAGIRQFFTRVVDAQSEQIVLQRKSLPAADHNLGVKTETNSK